MNDASGASGGNTKGYTKSTSSYQTAATIQSGTIAGANSASSTEAAKQEQIAQRQYETQTTSTYEKQNQAKAEADADAAAQAQIDAVNRDNSSAKTYTYTQDTGTTVNSNKDYSTQKESVSNIDTSVIDTSNASINKGTSLSGASSSDAIAGAMGDQYKVEEGDDYSWNKIASEMGQLYYNQESAQALADAVESKSELDTQATSAWNNYWAQEYSARQTQDKMGWTGGAKTASDLQTSFLQAEAASNMYTNYDLQRYGVDSKLSIARMYAEQQQTSLAQQYYQDAVSVALSEAEQTGYYISAENKELMSQYSVASEIINGNQTGDVDRAKVVKAACEAAWDQQGFSKDADGNYLGVETLSNLEYQETQRSNYINEELQRMQIEIYKSEAEAAWEQVEIAQRQAYANEKLADAEIQKLQQS